MIIKESFLLIVDNADILAAPSRLAALPSNGILTIEACSTDLDSTNFGLLTLQLPDGVIPFENLHIPMGGLTADALLDIDTKLLVTMPVQQGGHVGLAYDENGNVSAVLIVVTLSF